MPRKNGHNLIIPPREPMDRPDFSVLCDVRVECAGCPYPRHGFICHFSDGSCLKTRFDEIVPPAVSNAPMFPKASFTQTPMPAQS